ncbi:MAG: hypothetical protein KBA46_08185 [Candidatus Omnitrophica bacterium]|nr:hypothetical protein [Candidatus Omnitrophota bacterium]
MESCYERLAYLELLEKRAQDIRLGYRQNIAITGDELTGKTYLLSKFIAHFYDPLIVILYLEIRLESLDTFAKRFISTLLYNFLYNKNIPLKEDLGFLMNKCSAYLPVTIAKIQHILTGLQNHKRSTIFNELLLLCDSFHLETGKYCVVIFDEFHNLESLGIRTLYREWAKLLITQKKTMFIISSSKTSKTKSILSKDLSLLFGNFELVSLEPFDIKTSTRYLTQRLSQSPFTEGLKNFLVHFTGGHPFYLKIIADAIATAAHKDIASVMEELLFETSGILNQKFSNYLKCFLDKPQSKEYVTILYHISCGHTKIKDIAQLMHKTKAELTQRLTFLVESDAITKSADFLKMNDRVFAFWIRFVHQEKSKSLTFDSRNQKQLFKDNIQRNIEEFSQSALRPISERLTEVMFLFDDETIQIEKKKLRLSQFREIKPLTFNDRSFKDGLIGRSAGNLWIMAFKSDALTEEDIAEFAKECKKYRCKLQQKIVVTLGTIDPNARLRALEEKILTWDINNLNQMLDLFAKPRVIVHSDYALT